MILAFDPGDTVGIAEFNEEGECVAMLQLPFEAEVETSLISFLDNYPFEVTTVVVEDYILWGRKARQQSGSRLKASQGIGTIKAFAMRQNAAVVMQRSDILPIAERLTQVKIPRQHAQSHQICAYLHGMYWLIQQNRAQTALQRSSNGGTSA